MLFIEPMTSSETPYSGIGKCKIKNSTGVLRLVLNFSKSKDFDKGFASFELLIVGSGILGNSAPFSLIARSEKYDLDYEFIKVRK